MSWDAYRVLLAVARRSNLTTAARDLGVSQSTVSRAIARLEQELATKLVTRSAAGVMLTATAVRLTSSLEAMEQAAASVQRSVLEEDVALAGELRVATTEAFGAQLIVPALPKFTALYPRIRVVLALANETVAMWRRDADVSIRALRPRERSVIGRKCAELRLAIYASPTYLQTAGTDPRAQFRGARFIGYSGAARRWPEAAWLARNASAAEIPLEVDSVPALVAAAEAGLGLAIIPCYLADRQPHLQRIGAVVPELRREVWLVTHRETRKNARVRAFADFASGLIERSRAALRGE